MKSIKNPIDVIEIAIRIEKYGEQIYGELINKFDNEDVKKFFTLMKKEEIEHKELFINILKEIPGYDFKEDYPGEYGRFLDVEAFMFIKNLAISKISEINSFKEAVELSKDFEKATIKLYEKFITIFPDSPHLKALNRLVKEEIEHLEELEKIEF